MSRSAPELVMRLRDGTAVGPQAVLRSGTKFEFMVTLTEPAYLYVLQFYERGAQRIYPQLDAPVQHRAGLTRLPANPGQWFELDHNVGEETLYFLISETPIAEPGDHVERQLAVVQRSPMRVPARAERAAAPRTASPAQARPTASARRTRQGRAGRSRAHAPGNRETERATERALKRTTRVTEVMDQDVPVDKLPGRTAVDTRGVFISTDVATDAAARGGSTILHVTFQHRGTPVARQ